MHLDRLRARTFRQQVILLLLPVLAFRLLFPAGFMPRLGDDLELSMQMCHGDARSATVMRLLADGPAAPADDARQHDTPCVFAAVGAFTPPEPPLAALDVASREIVTPPPIAPAPVLRLPHRPQSPRAPPLSV